MGRLLPVVKVVFILLLLGAFLYLMARPSFDKFIKGGVMVEVSVVTNYSNYSTILHSSKIWGLRQKNMYIGLDAR